MEGCDACFPQDIFREIAELEAIWKDNRMVWLLFYQPLELVEGLKMMDMETLELKLKEVTEARQACQLRGDRALQKFHESERKVERLARELGHLENQIKYIDMLYDCKDGLTE